LEISIQEQHQIRLSIRDFAIPFHCNIILLFNQKKINTG
jgi:hypothetical protein